VKASAPFSVFSRAAAGTADVGDGDPLAVADGLDDRDDGGALLTLPDGDALVGGSSLDD
jgi:hypothetical protein